MGSALGAPASRRLGLRMAAKKRGQMEQRRINEKTSAFANMSRRAAGAPRAEPIDTAKTHRYIFSLSLHMPFRAPFYAKPFPGGEAKRTHRLSIISRSAALHESRLFIGPMRH
jgi:hypothetical protein